jgi:mono/diheme cytochrome c family protein
MNQVIHRRGIRPYVLFIILIVVFICACQSRFDPGLAQENNGEVIYYYGYNNQGEAIPHQGGPHWLYMHGGSCVDCHGPDGRGGVPVMMLSELPPDIRYETLISEEHHHGEGETDEHEIPYTDELIIRAIREGIEADGEVMDRDMPRWDLPDDDAKDLLEYLKML